MPEDPAPEQPSGPTRDTERPRVLTHVNAPARSGALEPGDEPSTPRPRTHWRGGSRRQALYFIVLAMLVVGLLLVALDQWRKGLVVMGSSILLGGAARAVLPTRLVGWLAVRNRTSDLVFCIAFGVLLIVTAVVARGEI